jgi:hypothetical protein
VDLWALDEVHFQQQGSRYCIWVPPETKGPTVYHHPKRKSAGYFAAVRLRDGEFLFRRETGRFNRDRLGISESVSGSHRAVPGRRVLAISDNAQGIASNSIWSGAASRLLRSAWTTVFRKLKQLGYLASLVSVPSTCLSSGRSAILWRRRCCQEDGRIEGGGRIMTGASPRTNQGSGSSSCLLAFSAHPPR